MKPTQKSGLLRKTQYVCTVCVFVYCVCVCLCIVFVYFVCVLCVCVFVYCVCVLCVCTECVCVCVFLSLILQKINKISNHRAAVRGEEGDKIISGPPTET